MRRPRVYLYRKERVTARRVREMRSMRLNLVCRAVALTLLGSVVCCAGSLASASATSKATSTPGASRQVSSRAELTQVALNTAPASSASYRIGPLDVLDISVFQVPDLTKSVQVSDTGTINLPLLGEVAGRWQDRARSSSATSRRNSVPNICRTRK